MTPVTKKEEFISSLMPDFFGSENFFGKRRFENEMSESIPAVNITENNAEYCLEFAAPGFSKSDFNVQVGENVLTVSAMKREEKQDENNMFTRREFSYSSFSRSFSFPSNVNKEKIGARYSEGILKLSIPKL